MRRFWPAILALCAACDSFEAGASAPRTADAGGPSEAGASDGGPDPSERDAGTEAGRDAQPDVTPPVNDQSCANTFLCDGFESGIAVDRWAPDYGAGNEPTTLTTPVKEGGYSLRSFVKAPAAHNAASRLVATLGGKARARLKTWLFIPSSSMPTGNDTVLLLAFDADLGVGNRQFELRLAADGLHVGLRYNVGSTGTAASLSAPTEQWFELMFEYQTSLNEIRITVNDGQALEHRASLTATDDPPSGVRLLLGLSASPSSPDTSVFYDLVRLYDF